MTITQVQEQLLRADSLLAHLRRSATESPRPSALANIRAMEKEYQTLQSQFEALAALEESDVYRYRIINEDRPKIAALADSWRSFQDLFSVAYLSLRGG